MTGVQGRPLVLVVAGALAGLVILAGLASAATSSDPSPAHRLLVSLRAPLSLTSAGPALEAARAAEVFTGLCGQLDTSVLVRADGHQVGYRKAVSASPVTVRLPDTADSVVAFTGSCRLVARFTVPGDAHTLVVEVGDLPPVTVPVSRLARSGWLYARSVPGVACRVDDHGVLCDLPGIR